MQKTRQKIIDYLRENNEATINELCEVLGNLTPVTVRHHLDVLRSDGLVSPPEIMHGRGPGRPQHIYHLTEKAHALLPQNVHILTNALFLEVKSRLTDKEINLIFDGMADRMAEGFHPGDENEPFTAKLDRIVQHLEQRGYDAGWEMHETGYVLITNNCPYSGVVADHRDVCQIDMIYLSRLLERMPQRISHQQENAPRCAYLIPFEK